MPFTGATEAVVTFLFGLKTRSKTDVSGPGAGEIWPVIEMVELPE